MIRKELSRQIFKPLYIYNKNKMASKTIWKNKNKLCSKNDLPVVYTIDIAHAIYVKFIWKTSNLQVRKNDLPNCIYHDSNINTNKTHDYKMITSNYNNIKFNYNFKTSNYKYNGYAYIFIHDNEINKEYKFIKGICFKQLKKQLND